MQKKLMLMALTLTLILTMAACGKTSTPDPNEVLVKVNGEEIKYSEFEVKYNESVKYYEGQGATLTDAQKVQLKNSILDSLIKDLILKQYAAKDDYQPTEEEITKQYDSFVKQYETEEKLIEKLTENNMTVESFKEDLKLQLDIDKFLNDYVKEKNLYGKLVVTDKEVEDQFKQLVLQTGNKDLKLDDYAEAIKSQIKSQKMNALVSEIATTLMSDSTIEGKKVFE